MLCVACLTHLLVVGEASLHGRVDDAVEHHGERVHGQRAVTRLLLHQVTQLLIGQLHGLHGVRQGADLLLPIGMSVTEEEKRCVCV